jgi:hypothetical protein
VSNFGNVTSAGWIIDPPTMIDDYESPTVIRLLVSLQGLIQTLITVGNGFIGFGIYVATGDEDDTVLPTVLWDPMGDQQSDWLYRYVAPFSTSTPANTLFFNQSNDKGYDVRSKRKVPRGAGLLAVFQTDNATAGGSIPVANIAVDVRALIISG